MDNQTPTDTAIFQLTALVGQKQIDLDSLNLALTVLKGLYAPITTDKDAQIEELTAQVATAQAQVADLTPTADTLSADSITP